MIWNLELAYSQARHLPETGYVAFLSSWYWIILAIPFFLIIYPYNYFICASAYERFACPQVAILMQTTDWHHVTHLIEGAFCMAATELAESVTQWFPQNNPKVESASTHPQIVMQILHDIVNGQTPNFLFNT